MAMPLPKKSSKLYLVKVFDAMVSIKAEKIHRQKIPAIFIREYISFTFYFGIFQPMYLIAFLKTVISIFYRIY